jgi:hypothetical protein
MSASPTQLSLRFLRNTGWTAGIVERWIERVKKRIDLFHFADIVAVREDQPVLFVQTTTRTNLSARLRKLRTIPAVRVVLLSGSRVVVHGWEKVAGKWEPVKREVKLWELQT